MSALGSTATAPSVSAAPRQLVIDTVAGTGDPLNNGDGGPARHAAVAGPDAVATGPDGTLYLVAGLTVRAVDPRTGVIRTVAGTGKPGFSGDGGPATKATFSGRTTSTLYGLSGIAVGADGTLYIADAGNHRVRAVDPDDGTITTVAGRGGGKDDDRHFSGDGGPATKAELHYPRDVAVGPDGTLYVVDAQNYRVRAVDPKTKRIRTVAGTRHAGDGGSGFFPRPDDTGTKATGTFVDAVSVAVDADGLLYLAEDQADRVRVVDPAKNTITTLAGRGTSHGYLDNPTDVAVDGDTLYISANDVFAVDESKNRVYAFDLNEKMLTEFAGGAKVGALGDGGKPTDAYLAGPGSSGTMGVAVGPRGGVYIADVRNNRVRVVREGELIARRAAHRLAGTPIVTLLGSGRKWSEQTKNEQYGDEQGTFYRDVHGLDEVDLDGPESVAVDTDGTVYVADTGNDRIRVLAPGDDRVRTLAGRPDSPDSDADDGDDGAAKDAYLSRPRGLALVPGKRLYFVDDGSSSEKARIRYVDLVEGTVHTVAGSRNEFGALVDVTVDRSGVLHAAAGGERVCRMKPTDDACTTLIDEKSTGYHVVSPKSVAVGRDGTVYVADEATARVLAYNPRTKAVRTVAGARTFGLSGDGGSATSAQVGPFGALAYGPDDTLYLTDAANHRVRAIDLKTGVIRAVAGDGRYEKTASRGPYEPQYGGGGFGGDGAPARKAKLNNPADVTVGPGGELYVADSGNNRIRVIGDADVADRGGIRPRHLVVPVVVLLALAAAAFVLRRRWRRTPSKPSAADS